MRERGPLLDPRCCSPAWTLFQPYDQRFQRQPGLLPPNNAADAAIAAAGAAASNAATAATAAAAAAPAVLSPAAAAAAAGSPRWRYAPHALQRSVSPPLPRAGAPMPGTL